MAQFYTFCVLLILSVSFSVGENPGKKIVLDISDFVDRVNPLITTIIADNNHDSLQLPNAKDSVSLAKVQLTNVYLHGFSKFYRYKPAVLTYENRQLDFEIGWEIKNISLTADYYAKRLLSKSYGKVLAVAAPLDLDFGISLDFENSTITVTKFYIPEFKTIETLVTGGSNSFWVDRAVSTVAKRILLNIIGNPGAKEISNNIQSIFDKFGPDYVKEMLQL